MRLRTHLITSALTGIALYPRTPRQAALLTLAGVLIDGDHYLLYALRSGDWSLPGAIRYNRRRNQPIRAGDTRPRYGPLRSILHNATLTVPLAWLLSWRWPALRPLAAGLTLHLALDTALPLSLDWRVWRRARGRCERCGVGGVSLGVYVVRPSQRGGSFWALDNRAAWCHGCAQRAQRDLAGPDGAVKVKG